MSNPISVSKVTSYVTVGILNQAKTKKQAVVDTTNAKLHDIRSQTDAWNKFKSKISAAADTLGAIESRVQGMLNMLDAMVRTINNAGGSDNPSAYAVTFNSYLRSLHNTATASGLVPNLTGLREGATLTYPTNIHGAEATVEGSFIGNEYRIDDTTGRSWVVDRGMDTIKRWDDYPDTPSGQSGNLADGLQYVSNTGSEVTFIYGAGTASPETVTGTIVSSGLPVMDAWYYESLSTEAGRTRALADLEAVRGQLKNEFGRYSSSADVVRYHQARIDTVLNAFYDQQTAVNVESADAQQKIEDEAGRQKALATMALSAQQTGYSELLSALRGGRKAGMLQFNPASLFSVKA
ncbi:hypothetical protein [Magnetospirillum sp. UT-4]|uniref:hypothetical protein n=1 Tax=Magnetospirillum sp. UT-4 TaxID=2681467 RepID=UPI0013818A20|nr:hypothetical protein [Magnetospirillum sp. UT-4]CAA7618652.1 hypothetical protein MTBUT4_30131 [Magnetospirillum sp. UT-4]